MKLIDDTLKVNGRYSQRRIKALLYAFISVIYPFIPMFIDNFDVKEFVFLGFLGAGGFALYATLQKNKNT